MLANMALFFSDFTNPRADRNIGFNGNPSRRQPPELAVSLSGSATFQQVADEES
jgi:hypothetical protein